MNQPKVFIMDEPSSGLDPLIQREFQAMLREVAEKGRTVFLSSHTLSEVQRVADRVGIIRHGKLVAVEIVSELRSKAIRRIELEFSTPVEAAVFEVIPGVREVSVEDHRVAFSYDGNMEVLLRAVMDRYDLVDIHTQEADLEEIFLTYYRDEEVSA
jgi:ABC-2 type transport system ATP-binding protein